MQMRHAADGREGARMRADPIAEPLRPGRLDVGEVRGAHHRDEDLRLAHLAGQPVDDHRHRVAGVIDEQLVAAHMGLAHRDRELAFPDAVQLAEARVAVAVRIARDVLVPQDRQRDVLALEFAMDARPVGLDLAPVALLGPGLGEQPCLEHGIGHLVGQWPAQSGRLETSDCRYGPSTAPLRSDGRSHGSVRHQRTSTEALRARGAWSFSLLASGPSFGKPKERT